MSPAPFWQTTALDDMTREEWESLCDGCAKCCLHKLEDEDSGDVVYTDVACRYLDDHTCFCSDYEQRQQLVPACITLTPGKVHEQDWLPSTCAYKLLAEGKSLHSWHPLISGDSESVHRAGISVRYRSISEDRIQEADMQERIVHWVF